MLEQYVTASPSPQNALNIFAGAWSSKLPGPLAELSAGPVELFADFRIEWFISEIGGCAGKTVLELGPLEAGHSYMLETMGAKEVIAVEANTHAYLKCLIIKELLDLKRVRFLCGDFVQYLRETKTMFDLGLASGVLYHMPNPVELIELITRRCNDTVFLWTHYYDQAVITSNPMLAAKHTSNKPASHAGFEHTLYHYEYQAALDWAGFCGGSAPYSSWMSRADILRCLSHFGFGNLSINFDDPTHPNGPAFSVIARRQA